MSEKTVMQIADDIMSKMGMVEESVQSPTEENVTLVGRGEQDLPKVSDGERESLIEVSLGLTAPTKKVDADADGDSEETLNTTVPKLKFAQRKDVVGTVDKVNVPRTNAKRSRKLRRAAKEIPTSTGWRNVGEMTTVGSIGVNFAGGQKFSSKKKRKLSSFLDPISGNKVEEYDGGGTWINAMTSDFIDKTLGRIK